MLCEKKNSVAICSKKKSSLPGLMCVERRTTYLGVKWSLIARLSQVIVCLRDGRWVLRFWPGV